MIVSMVQCDFETQVYRTVGSTMDVARGLVSQCRETGQILTVAAVEQTAGRGRRGRTWVQSSFPDTPHSAQESPNNFASLDEAFCRFGDVLPFSVVIPAQRLRVPVEWVSLLVGCAVWDALAELVRVVGSVAPSLGSRPTTDGLFLKWPNDILVTNRAGNLSKVCGILCEASFNGKEFDAFVIGVGLNFFSHPGVGISGSFWDWLLDGGADFGSVSRFRRLFERDEERHTLLLGRFGALLQRELQSYLLTARVLGQMRDLVLARTFPLGTRFVVDGESRGREFLGLLESGALLLEGLPSPLLAGDISVVPEQKPQCVADESSSVFNLSAQGQQVANVRMASSAPALVKNPRAVLALDVGNSRTHWCYGYSGEAPLVSGDVEHSCFLEGEQSGCAEAVTLWSSLERVLPGSRPEQILVLAAAVADRALVRRILSCIERGLRARCPGVRVVNQEITTLRVLREAGLEGQYRSDQLGVDRALRFFHACERSRTCQCAVVVLTPGTALTVEAVNSTGQVIESAIIPGLQMALDSLHENTAALPHLVPDLGCEKASLRTTEAAMQRGLELTLEGLIRTLLHEVAPGQVILSGGNGEVVTKWLESVFLKDERSWTLEWQSHLETRVLLKLAERLAPEQIEFGLPWQASNDMSAETKAIWASMQTPGNSGCTENLETSVKDRASFRRIGLRLEADTAGERLDRYLAQNFRFHVREAWQRRIGAAEVLLEHGAPRRNLPAVESPQLHEVKATYRLQAGDQIWLFHPPAYEPGIVDSCRVLADDGDVVVFAKPGNLVIHAVGQYSHNTFLTVAKRMGYGDASPVHRIDRETSGILVCARQPATRNKISEAFREIEMQKLYLAVTRGGSNQPDRFRVVMPIGPAENSLIRLKQWVGGVAAQDAETWFARLASCDDCVLWACLPKTGRTNQIRIHLAALGAWIVGDKMYHADETIFLEYFDKGLTQRVMDAVLVPRHMLHNAGIKGPDSLGSTLGTQPLICEIPDDFMDFPPTAQLLQLAGLSLEPAQQRQDILDLFNRLTALTFDVAPCFDCTAISAEGG